MCRKPIKRMQMLIFIMMLKRTWQDQKRLHMSIDQHGNLRPHSRHQPLIQHASSFQATWTSWELPWTNSHEGKARIEVFIIRVRTLRSHANCRQPNFMLFTVCRIRCSSMLDQYIGECMYQYTISNMVSKDLADQYLNCNTTIGINTWWVPRDEKIFVYPSHYLG